MLMRTEYLSAASAAITGRSKRLPNMSSSCWGEHTGNEVGKNSQPQLLQRDQLGPSSLAQMFQYCLHQWALWKKEICSLCHGASQTFSGAEPRSSCHSSNASKFAIFFKKLTKINTVTFYILFYKCLYYFF